MATFVVKNSGGVNYCSYSRYDNQTQNSLNQITLNLIQKIMCQFTSLLTEHFDYPWHQGLLMGFFSSSVHFDLIGRRVMGVATFTLRL